MASIVLFLLALSAATSAVPIQQQHAEVNDITGQVKKADEFIFYGNHQNVGRIKKSDPDVISNKLTAVGEVAEAEESADEQKPSNSDIVPEAAAAHEAENEDGATPGIDNAALEEYLLNSYDDYYGERMKRSAPLTADNMQNGAASKASSRKRRDLTDAEIAALLEARQYEAAAEQEQPPRQEELGDLWRQELLDRYIQGEEQEEPAEQDFDDSRTMLRYLNGENTEEQPYVNDAPEDLADETTADIEPIYYHGRVGVFVPVKRSFISAVPGVRKRSGGYGSEDNLAYLDDYVGALERRRNEEETERLYELAVALNAANDK